MSFIDIAELPDWRGRLLALSAGKATTADHPQRTEF